jgi:uncharacterized protein YndB with AHSA1/START domain
MTTNQAFVVNRSILINAPAEDIWNVIVSPLRWKTWMLVEPDLEGGGNIRIGSRLLWSNERREVYLTGTVATLEPNRRLVIDLDDVSWQRRPRPNEVTLSFILTEQQDRTRVEFSLGDLSIDPEGRQWHEAYANSKELEAIKDIAELER